MATIDEFKAQLIGGGPRANRFRVFIPRAGNRIEFLAKAAAIPAATLGEIPVNFRGHILKLAGDRTFEDWSVTIINDSEFSARSALEAWQQDIQELDSGVGMASNDYLLSRAFVEQLGKDDAVLARYEFFNMVPKNIAAIELSYETVDALEEFQVDFTYSHWERVK
jgi:hypothetical protein